MCLPPNMADLGPNVWSPQGVKILGTPVGSEQFIEEAVQRRLEEETDSVGRDTVSARHAVRLANPFAVCRAKVSALVANGSKQLFSHVRCGA